jgi:hypothetical protein
MFIFPHQGPKSRYCLNFIGSLSVSIFECKMSLYQLLFVVKRNSVYCYCEAIIVVVKCVVSFLELLACHLSDNMCIMR